MPAPSSKSKRVIVTAGLPYANGSLHLGHMVEYCQADIYTRALKRLGQDALYICANDAHGTPIEVNAKRLGISPESLVQGMHKEHKEDFAKFDVEFDHFSITHSDSNKAIVEDVYRRLREAGELEDREVDGNWCENDQRFLPDRFVTGICPKCDTPDQYGDVCESCNSTYSPVDLKEARCVLCGNTPVIKTSTHVFFKLSAQRHVDFLRKWIDSGALQSDVANYVRGWLDNGLLDWCISRDGPYFGFEIPDRPGKYFYVWLDAPFGYVSSSAEWGEAHGLTLDSLWRDDNTRIEHIIGKDIIYFHTLFWPAVLNATGYTLPSTVHVHGMLTIDGTKMSKTRGTFINARVFAEHVEPQALRYFYACKYGASTDDLDLALGDFVQRVNSELVNKHANLFSRAAQFLLNKLDGRLGDLPFSQADALSDSEPADGPSDILSLARRVVASCRKMEGHYRAREFGHVARELTAVADIGNEFMQNQKPWEQLKSDPEAARVTCTFALNVCHALAMYIWPIVPRFSEAGARVLDCKIDNMSSSALFAQRNRAIGAMERLFDRIDDKQVQAIVEASKSTVKATGTATHVSGDASTSERAPIEFKPEISFDDFTGLDLRAGTVVSAERIAKSKKLLRLEIDIGEAQPRQVVAGLAHVYEPEKLLGTQVVVVANLAPAKLMGVESHGMVLAAGSNNDMAVLRLDRAQPPGAEVR